ncbi:MAG: glycyl-radical enzyme activating protein [Clostridia bacterium]|nr:glycyl-radical enzyme activating protein [Clostridia bacterium]
MTNGVIFDIKEFTLHDGPGVRTTVFLKGCPLRCVWCHNPEGLDVTPTLLYKERLCAHCGACRRPCDHPECKPFGRCIKVCPKGALSVAGREVDAGALAERLARSADLYTPDENGIPGGVTVSGGEPLRQGTFSAELGKQLRERGIHTALQTSGYAQKETFSAVLEHFDYVLFDLKLADDELHRKYTGVSNGPIHENLRYLQASGKPHVVRIPLIPGITDTEDNLRALADLAGDSMVECMPYNPFAGAKYAMTGKEFLYEEPQKKQDIPDLSMFRHVKLLK